MRLFVGKWRGGGEAKWVRDSSPSFCASRISIKATSSPSIFRYDHQVWKTGPKNTKQSISYSETGFLRFPEERKISLSLIDTNGMMSSWTGAHAKVSDLHCIDLFVNLSASSDSSQLFTQNNNNTLMPEQASQKFFTPTGQEVDPMKLHRNFLIREDATDDLTILIQAATGALRSDLDAPLSLQANLKKSESLEINPFYVHHFFDEFDAIIDVREPSELAKGFIPNSINIPLGQVIRDGDKSDDPTFMELRKKKNILVYCAAGVRSKVAAEHLRKYKLPGVSLEGGYKFWQQIQAVNN